MDRSRDDARRRGRVALAGIAAVLALLAPSLLASPADASASIGLAVLALLLAAVVRLGDQHLVLAGRLVATGLPARRAVPPVLTGCATDTTHHPLRPRAPGTP